MALELRPHLEHAIVPAYSLDRARFFTLPSTPPPTLIPPRPTFRRPLAFLESFPSASSSSSSSAADDLLATLKRLVNGSVISRVGDKEMNLRVPRE